SRPAARGGAGRGRDVVPGIQGQAAAVDGRPMKVRVALLMLAVAWFAASLHAQQAATDVKAVHVQGSVYMIVGAGANLAVQVGEQGVFVVDTGAAPFTDRIIAAIRELSKKDIRWIVNTTLDPDHIGGNEKLSS